MSAPPHLILRADAGEKLGTGHVRRCLALAEAWQERGGAASFACAALPAFLRARLDRDAFAVVPMPGEPGGREDAWELRQVAAASGAVVVLDGYRLGAAFQAALHGHVPRLAVIDDHGRTGTARADLVVDQNLGVAETTYAGIAAGARILLGPRYALLRREFRALYGKSRSAPATARRVIVTLGGTDPMGLTARVLAALDMIASAELEITVLAAPAAADLHAGAADRHRVTVIRDPREVAPLIAASDLAVAAAGTTSWELAHLGVPAVLLTAAANQEPVAAALVEAGVAVSLGDGAAVSPEHMASTLARVIADRAAREAMSERGMALVDGQGAVRVAAVLAGDERALVLRRPTSADARLFWEWRNDPGTRAAAFSSEPIPWPRHLDWFMERLRDAAAVIVVAEDLAGSPVGHLRFDCGGGSEAEVHVTVSPAMRGRGIGTRLIREGCADYARLRAARRIHADIRPENTPSIRAFQGAGFVASGRAAVRGHNALHFVLDTGAGAAAAGSPNGPP